MKIYIQRTKSEIIQSTPQDFFNKLNKIFRFTLDVCALPENAKCESYYTPDDDGLSKSWMGGGMVQPSLRKGYRKMVQKSFRGIQKRILRFYCNAYPCKNGYKLVPRICTSFCKNDYSCQRTTEIQWFKAVGTFPEYIGCVH